MTRSTLPSQKRTLLGRKIKLLRRQNLIPGNVFGKKVKSLAVQVDALTFKKIYDEAGETGLVDLVVDKDAPRPVLITNVQLNPVTEHPIHVDFHQVDLTEKVTADIPVELIGESPAVKEKAGVLVPALSEVEVEALPTDLPEKFEIDISVLKEIGDSITVAAIKVSSKVEIKVAPEEVVVLVQAQKEEVEEAPPAPAEGEEVAEGAAAPAEGEAKEGEAKPTEAKKEEGGGEAKKE